jgi:hypothetical protein
MDLVHHAVQRERPASLPPTPLTPLVACVAGAAALFGLETLSGLRGSSLLVTPISIALLGVFLALNRWDDRRRLRAAADEWIARGYENPKASRYAWRIGELTSARERRQLGRSVRGIVPALAAGRLPGASPLNRPTLRPYRAELIALADRLDDLERPVPAAGILAVWRLLTEPGSVLYTQPYFDERRRDIGTELAAILDRLEVRP